MVAFNTADFSEIVRTLSPSRFRRFMEGVLDIEQGYAHNPKDINGFGTAKYIGSTSELGFSSFRYVQTSHSGYGYLRDEISEFIITHHVPSFIADIEYLDILSRDLKAIDWRHLKHGFGTFSYYPGNVATYYGTNKDYGPQLKTDAEGWLSALADAFKEAGINFAISCIDPYTIATRLEDYPDTEQVLLDVLNQPDGIVVEVAETGISVRPFVASDVLVSDGTPNAYVFNVDATPLATSRIESLEGLQDTLILAPDERHIESFLIAHPNILLGAKYAQLRTQITIAPTGERPDFFLERLDGLWEILELKRPMPAKLLIEDPASPPLIARYLEQSLKQCIKYLRLLETVDVRNRLLREGIRIEQPRVTLLIGKQQYPQSMMDIVRSAYDDRITLLSFEELYENCKRQAAITLTQMKSLQMRSGKGEVP